MAPTLYLTPVSPPARAVLIAAKAIGLDLTLQEVNTGEGQHKSPEFLKINPQHTLPTLKDDDGYVVWDSHAIMIYLVTKYAKDDSLYPKDFKKRAIIDQRLHFDSGVTWAKILQITGVIVYQGKKAVDQQGIDTINEVYAFVDAFLDGKEWIAGDLSIADFSFITSITSVNCLVKVDGEKYPRLAAYLKRAETLPAYEVDRKGLAAFKVALKALLD